MFQNNGYSTIGERCVSLTPIRSKQGHEIQNMWKKRLAGQLEKIVIVSVDGPFLPSALDLGYGRILAIKKNVSNRLLLGL
jgi:hypothetical protein